MKMLFVSLFLCLFLLLSSTMVCMAISEAEASSKIREAENAINSAYDEVLEAEKAGANIAGLLSILNDAGELFSRANLAYSIGDFDSAFDFAVWSKEKLNGFGAEADALRETAVQQHDWDFMFYVMGSIVGAIGVIFGGFVVWFFLRRRYEKAGSVV